MYVTVWWRIDPFLYMTLMLKTPVAVDLNQMSGVFTGSPRSRPPVEAPAPGPDARTTQAVMGGTAYGWLTLATAGTFALALAGGAAIGRSRGTQWRRNALVVLIVVVLGLGVAALFVLRGYGWEYTPRQLRVGMCGLTLLTACMGCLLERRARVLGWIAASALVVSAVGTVVALKLGVSSGAIEPHYATPQALTAAFGIHSAYGWILMPVMRWLR